MDKPELKVSVFSDYICPFCYIGSRRLLRLNEEYDLRVNWCLVEIHPETPPEGMPVDKLGYAPEQWLQMMGSLEEMAREEGIAFAPHTITANSRKCLLLAEAAKRSGRAAFYRLHERLFEAFFVEGHNIGDEQVLRQLAAECAIADDVVDAAWHEPRYPEQLQRYLAWAGALQVRGTPTYVFGERLLRGAVPYENLHGAARELAASTD